MQRAIQSRLARREVLIVVLEDHSTRDAQRCSGLRDGHHGQGVVERVAMPRYV